MKKNEKKSRKVQKRDSFFESQKRVKQWMSETHAQ